MNSDIKFERLVKLWVSLWELILADKRHRATVAAFLQRIVFEESGYPRFKNWPEICKLGETNDFMMMAVATVDISEPDEATQQLIAALPQCFASEEVAGPFPLSVIRHNAETNADPRNDSSGDHPVSHNAVPESVPIQTFDKFGNNVASLDGPRLPAEIDPYESQGTIVTWKGRSFVVIENNEGCEELAIVPAECIAVDI